MTRPRRCPVTSGMPCLNATQCVTGYYGSVPSKCAAMHAEADDQFFGRWVSEQRARGCVG